MPITLNDEIARQYYATTAARSHRHSLPHYQSSSAGLVRWLEPWLPQDRGARCLDLACGCGEMLFALEQQGFYRTVGVDLCAEEIHEARHFVRGQLVIADALEFLAHTRAASFNFILALNFLEHLSKEQLRLVLTEVRRVLAAGGTFVVMVPNAISPLGVLTRHWDMTHEWAFTPNNFRQLAALVGFEPNIDFLECGPRVHGFVSTVRWLLWQAVRAVIAFRLLIEVADIKGGIYTMDMLVRLCVPDA